MNNQESPIVRQGNDLIEASYKIATVGESRLIRLLIAQIQPTDEEFKIYRINVIDFANLFGLNPRDGRIYELVDKASESLTGRRITIRDGKSWLHMNWLSSAKYIDGEGCVELRFDPNLKPYLLQLKGYYTQYKIEKISNFKSIYSIRLYELLKKEQFKKNGLGVFQRTFEYTELRDKLGVEKNEYEFFKDFRIKCIDISVREINSNHDIHILKVDYPKTGRKITHIVFHCEKAKQMQLDIVEAEPKLTEVKKEVPEYIQQLIAFGISEETAYKWRKKYGVARVIRNLGFVTAKKNAGKVKEDLAGYVASAIAKDYGQGWEDKAKIQQDEATARAEEERKRKAEEARLEAKKKEEADTLWASFKEWKPEEREALIRALLEGKDATLQVYERKGEDTAVVRSLVVQHLRQ